MSQQMTLEDLLFDLRTRVKALEEELQHPNNDIALMRATDIETTARFLTRKIRALPPKAISSPANAKVLRAELNRR